MFKSRRASEPAHKCLCQNCKTKKPGRNYKCYWPSPTDWLSPADNMLNHKTGQNYKQTVPWRWFVQPKVITRFIQVASTNAAHYKSTIPCYIHKGGPIATLAAPCHRPYKHKDQITAFKIFALVTLKNAESVFPTISAYGYSSPTNYIQTRIPISWQPRNLTSLNQSTSVSAQILS